jgi:uncharacterized damage-inducible protein DinB
MVINTIEPFLIYYEKIRQRTMSVIKCIPPHRLDWTYQPGKFTLGDLIRHLASIERFMFAENVQFRRSSYPGHGRELADGYDEVVGYMVRMHQESMEIFARLTDESLQQKCITPGGTAVTVWKWLRAMVEHEIHHRGQLYLYLGMLDVATPPLYGLTSEEVLERSK